MSKEVTTYELVNFVLGHRVKILKFVNSGEFLNVQTIWCNEIGLTLEKMFSFIARNFGDSRKDVSGMSGGTLEAVTGGARNLSEKRRGIEERENLPMINLSLSRFLVDRKFI